MTTSPTDSATTQPLFELLEGVLMVRTQSEQEFLAHYEEHFWVLVHSEHPRIVLDLGQTDGLDLTAYQMIALNLFEIDAGKHLTVRIPETIRKYFTQSKLYRKVDVEVVRVMGRARSVSEQEEESSLSASANESNEAITRMFREMESADPTKKKQLTEEARGALASLRESGEIPSGGEPGSEFGADESVAGHPRQVELEARTGPGQLDDARSGGSTPLPTSNGESFTIGRVPDNQMQIASPLISRRHCQVDRRGGIYYMTDLGSGNGTYVNGKRLDEQEPRALQDGDRIVLSVTRQFPQGAKVFVFHQDA